VNGSIREHHDPVNIVGDTTTRLISVEARAAPMLTTWKQDVPDPARPDETHRYHLSK
jgi:hypothetical protein